jgi:hypothetical protein
MTQSFVLNSHVVTTRRSLENSTRKTAISVPARLLAAVDEAARERGESRSRFIQRVLNEVVRARSDREIRMRIDALFSESSIARAQAKDAGELERLSTAWADESW